MLPLEDDWNGVLIISEDELISELDVDGDGSLEEGLSLDDELLDSEE
jgi:hypothetical protein